MFAVSVLLGRGVLLMMKRLIPGARSRRGRGSEADGSLPSSSPACVDERVETKALASSSPGGAVRAPLLLRRLSGRRFCSMVASNVMSAMSTRMRAGQFPVWMQTRPMQHMIKQRPIIPLMVAATVTPATVPALAEPFELPPVRLSDTPSTSCGGGWGGAGGEGSGDGARGGIGGGLGWGVSGGSGGAGLGDGGGGIDGGGGGDIGGVGGNGGSGGGHIKSTIGPPVILVARSYGGVCAILTEIGTQL